MTLRTILATFFDPEKQPVLRCEPVETGLINTTYKVEIGTGANTAATYILQKINPAVFKEPEAIMRSMDLIAQHLIRVGYSDQVLSPIRNRNAALLSYDADGNAWRLLPYISDSLSVSKISNPEQAFEAAKTFSRFYACLWEMELSEIRPAIPGFLDFSSRISAFQQALVQADAARKQTAAGEIAFVLEHLALPEKFIELQKAGNLPLRLIHGDPKIDNLLFDRTGMHGVCVIDLDTVMPGPLLYDFGDMIRSYTNNRAEDDPAASSIFNPTYYEAVRQGFLFYLGDKLSPIEAENLDYSARVVVFIQALRFLTDYLNADIYYKTTYPVQNLQRSRNQVNLLRALIDREHSLPSG
ncbi:MAG: aminoglycoside phosphotransferase family protein [Saprospiraceae bacterium]